MIALNDKDELSNLPQCCTIYAFVKKIFNVDHAQTFALLSRAWGRAETLQTL